MLFMPGLIIFLLGSLGIILLTLRLRSAHGVARFFAFEALMGLAVLNGPHWFEQPFAPRQLLSWALLLLSGFLAVHGFMLLKLVGKPQGNIEQTSVLVAQARRHIRHPLYSSLLWLGLGIFLKGITWWTAGLTVVVVVALLATARIEEAENSRRFGAAYEEYMRETRRFIPYVF
jgi:protein-S-isoprenylcysteine O-methyltransferase Ste14